MVLHALCRDQHTFCYATFHTWRNCLCGALSTSIQCWNQICRKSLHFHLNLTSLHCLSWTHGFHIGASHSSVMPFYRIDGEQLLTLEYWHTLKVHSNLDLSQINLFFYGIKGLAFIYIFTKHVCGKNSLEICYYCFQTGTVCAITVSVTRLPTADCLCSCLLLVDWIKLNSSTGHTAGQYSTVHCTVQYSIVQYTWHSTKPALFQYCQQGKHQFKCD